MWRKSHTPPTWVRSTITDRPTKLISHKKWLHFSKILNFGHRASLKEPIASLVKPCKDQPCGLECAQKASLLPSWLKQGKKKEKVSLLFQADGHTCVNLNKVKNKKKWVSCVKLPWTHMCAAYEWTWLPFMTPGALPLWGLDARALMVHTGGGGAYFIVGWAHPLMFMNSHTLLAHKGWSYHLTRSKKEAAFYWKPPPFLTT